MTKIISSTAHYQVVSYKTISSPEISRRPKQKLTDIKIYNMGYCSMVFLKTTILKYCENVLKTIHVGMVEFL